MDKMKQILGKVLNVIKSIYKHEFFGPVVSLLVGGLLTPVSPFLGGAAFGVMGYLVVKMLIDLKK